MSTANFNNNVVGTSDSMAKVFSIVELRSEIMSHLRGWEISAFIAATRTGWTKYDKDMATNMVRNMFDNAAMVEREISRGNTLVILGPVVKSIMTMIRDPFNIKTFKERLQKTFIITTIVTVRDSKRKIQTLGSDLSETSADEITEFVCETAYPEHSYGSTGWIEKARPYQDMPKMLSLSVSHMFSGRQALKLYNGESSLVVEKKTTGSYLATATISVVHGLIAEETCVHGEGQPDILDARKKFPETPITCRRRVRLEVIVYYLSRVRSYGLTNVNVLV